MKPLLFTTKVWDELTRIARASRAPCDVAVAYFGSGAAELLPLPKGSRLVVDASEAAVAAGQTCPADLAVMVGRGVQVFSVARLHAKVFVFGPTAYIGSANVSGHSARHLLECVVQVSDTKPVRQARDFIRSLCLKRLTPEFLERLQDLYRPPKFPGGGPRKAAQHKPVLAAALPCVRIARLQNQKDWPEWNEATFKEDQRKAEALREGPADYEVECFRWARNGVFKQGQLVIQITEMEKGRYLVSPPALVLRTVTRRKGTKKADYVYVEHPKRRRRSLDSLVRRLGAGAAAKLSRSGEVKDPEFARKLLGLWVD